MHDIKAVIFDLDDTLVSEYGFIVSGYKYMSEKLSVRLKHTPGEIEDRLWELSAQTYSHAFDRLFDSYGETCSEEELQELILLYRSHPAKLRFYPDVWPVLKGLRERKLLTGIISDGDPDRQKNKIRTAVAGLREIPGAESPENDRAYGAEKNEKGMVWPGEEIKRWFDEIILNDEFGGPSFRKPDPHGFKVMAGRLGTDPSSMIYIGDNPSKDFHIAADLPVRTARIIREKGIYNNRSYLDDIHETWRIDALTDILSIIDAHNGHKDREKE